MRFTTRSATSMAVFTGIAMSLSACATLSGTVTQGPAPVDGGRVLVFQHERDGGWRSSRDVATVSGHFSVRLPAGDFKVAALPGSAAAPLAYFQDDSSMEMADRIHLGWMGSRNISMALAPTIAPAPGFKVMGRPATWLEWDEQAKHGKVAVCMGPNQEVVKLTLTFPASCVTTKVDVEAPVPTSFPVDPATHRAEVTMTLPGTNSVATQTFRVQWTCGNSRYSVAVVAGGCDPGGRATMGRGHGPPDPTCPDEAVYANVQLFWKAKTPSCTPPSTPYAWTTSAPSGGTLIGSSTAPSLSLFVPPVSTIYTGVQPNGTDNNGYYLWSQAPEGCYYVAIDPNDPALPIEFSPWFPVGQNIPHIYDLDYRYELDVCPS